MRRVVGILGICGCSLLSANSHVWFLNGDRMEADFVEQQNQETRVRFPWHSEAVSIESRLIDKIDLGPSGDAKSGSHRFVFSNGDIMRGTLLSLDSTHARFKTTWGTVAQLARNQIDSITFSDSGGILFQGRGRLKDWKVNAESRSPFHSHSNGKASEGPYGLLLHGRTTISKRLPIQKEGLTLDLGMKFEGPYPNLTIFLNDLLVSNGKKTGVHLYFSRSTIYCRTMQDNRNSVDWRLRVSEVPDLLLGESRVVLTIDPENMKMALWVNQIKFHEWSYNSAKLSSRKSFTLQITSGNPNSDSWITDVSLMRGVLPPSEPAANTAQTGDSILLGNQDSLSGNVEKIKEDSLQLTVPGREAPLALDTRVINRIDFDSRERVIPKRLNEDVQLSLLDGSLVTVQLLDADQDGFRVRADALKEELAIPFDQVHLIKFNPYTIYSPPIRDRWMMEQLECL